MKKTLNLAIAVDRVEELYEIHKDFVSRIENEASQNEASQVRRDNNIAEFALTISNPVGVKNKGRPKGSNNVNADIKGKKSRYLYPIKKTKKIRQKGLKKYYKM